MAFAGHSLALLADAGHMLTGAGALAASLLAIRLPGGPRSGRGRSGSSAPGSDSYSAVCAGALSCGSAGMSGHGVYSGQPDLLSAQEPCHVGGVGVQGCPGPGV